MSLDLKSLSIPDAKLIQHGLIAQGFYEGTTRGLPGPKTAAAYAAYLDSFKNTEPENLPKLTAALIEILTSEEGVREIGTTNRGPRVQEYQAATWLEGSGWPWCAAFICWGILQLEEQFPLPFKRPRTAAAWGFEQWARDEGLQLFKPRKKIKAGDIVCFTFSHIGLAIEDESGGRVKTVEGNTDGPGSRDGGGVYIKTRRTSVIRSNIRLEAA